MYRFDEAVRFLREAVALDPENSRAQASLGLHLLRTGDEAEARKALDAAFARDSFDTVTYNLLSLMDTLDKFVTVPGKNLTIRLHEQEVAVLQPYLVPLAEQALADLSARYQFTPTGPILVEVFPRHDDFAVRTMGLPGMIGALGACFGRVVTMDSPKARPPGTFNWAATLWHELAHVITLQMSGNRLPRWLSEGISMFEETRARPGLGTRVRVAVRTGICRRPAAPACRPQQRLREGRDDQPRVPGSRSTRCLPRRDPGRREAARRSCAASARAWTTRRR